jgi:hypothetical protein
MYLNISIASTLLERVEHMFKKIIESCNGQIHQSKENLCGSFSRLTNQWRPHANIWFTAILDHPRTCIDYLLQHGNSSTIDAPKEPGNDLEGVEHGTKLLLMTSADTAGHQTRGRRPRKNPIFPIPAARFTHKSSPLSAHRLS